MESFQTFITESLDKPYDFKNGPHPNPYGDEDWNEDEPLHYAYKFEADSGTFIVNFKMDTNLGYDEYVTRWECYFAALKKDKKNKTEYTTTGITGDSKKDSMRIFATVIEIIDMWIVGTPKGKSRLHSGLDLKDDITELIIRVKKDEKSRVKLYERLFKKVNFKGFDKKFQKKYSSDGYFTIHLKRKEEEK
jgi:hypothetical protein